MSDHSAAGSFNERRMIGRALARWDRLLGERQRLPARSDCAAFARDGMAENLFLIAVGADEAGDRIVDTGPAFRRALAADPVGRSAIKVLPSATERGLSFCRVAAELMKPLVDTGTFTNANDEHILYRAVLLPLSEDERRIDHVLGAFSYRIAA